MRSNDYADLKILFEPRPVEILFSNPFFLIPFFPYHPPNVRVRSEDDVGVRR